MIYETNDWWDLYAHIGEMLGMGCMDLRKKGNGIPCKPGTNETMDEVEWDNILAKIQEAGHLMANDFLMSDDDIKTVNEGLLLLATHWRHLWD